MWESVCAFVHLLCLHMRMCPVLKYLVDGSDDTEDAALAIFWRLAHFFRGEIDVHAWASQER